MTPVEYANQFVDGLNHHTHTGFDQKSMRGVWELAAKYSLLEQRLTALEVTKPPAQDEAPTRKLSLAYRETLSFIKGVGGPVTLDMLVAKYPEDGRDTVGNRARMLEKWEIIKKVGTGTWAAK